MEKQNINSKGADLFIDSDDGAQADPKNTILKRVQPSINRRTAVHLFLIIIFSIFIGDAIIMLLINALPPLTPLVTVLLAATLLLVVVFPVLYFFVFRPLMGQITERPHTEEALRKNEKLFRSLFENMLNGFAYCQMHFDDNDKPCDFTYLSVNSAFGTLTRLKNVVGKKVTEVIPGIRESNPELLEIYGRVSKTGKPEQFEMFVGSLQLWFNISVYSPEQGYFVAVFDVITERKQAVEALKNTLSSTEAILESIHNGILVVSDQGTVIKANTKFAEMWRIPDDILASGDDKILLDSVLGQLADPDGFIAKVNELYGKTEAESLDEIALKDGRLFNRISKPLYLGREPKGRVWSFLDITERKLAEEKILDDRLLLRTLIDNIPDSIYCKDLACRKTLINLTELRFIGVKSEAEVLGKDDFDFYPKELAEKFFADDQSVIQTGKPVLNREEYILDENKQKRWLLTSKLPLRDKDGRIIGLVGIGRDVTERKQAEEALRKSEEKYRHIYENTQEGIFQTTVDGTYISVNLALAKMFGYESPEELMNSRSDIAKDAYSDSEERNHFLQMMEEHGFVKSYEYEAKRKDGQKIWFFEDARAIKDENGKVQYFEGFVADITERKHAEAEIKLKNEELLKSNSEKDKFFSIIAHDLRGPFNGFLGLTQIMAEELPSLTMEELQKMAVSMEKSASKLFRLLENLLYWARIQQGLIPFNPTVVELLPLVDESISIILEQAKSKGVEIALGIPNNLMVFADHNMLQTIIRNLLSNAVKFTRKGGNVALTVKTSDDKNVEISIKDTGIGMSQTIVDQLFRLDVQTSREGTDGEPSSGLGLLLCKEFIEKHGGKIWVESEEGVGSTFYFTLASNNT